VEGLFAHIPGLRVGLPATPGDAYAMLRAAIASDDPVLVIESRRLYPVKGPVGLDDPVEAVGGSRVVAADSSDHSPDLTLVSWGASLADVALAREELAAAGVHPEVIDLRWLSPLDLGPVLDSVARTRRLAVVHEANRTAGFGAEVVARVCEAAGGELASRPLRIATPDARIPAAPVLSAALLPGPDRITADVLAWLGERAERALAREPGR
jgi:pyruvate/2-oxoglutarate/acetoin dehydrogenase E1 component